MKLKTHRVAELTEVQQSALRNLSLAVYPPEVLAVWPGRAIDWAAPQWSVVAWDDGQAFCHVGVVLRDARWNECAVRIGGIGGVKTHPDVRGRGLATTTIHCALDVLREHEDVDFALLVCDPRLVPFYERLGWQEFSGELLVTQKQGTVPFTFNLPMTIPMRLRESLSGTIDLMGPPW